MTMDAATEVESVGRGLYSEGFGGTDQVSYIEILQLSRAHLDILGELSQLEASLSNIQNVRTFLRCSIMYAMSVPYMAISSVIPQLIVEGSTEQKRFELTENSTVQPEHPVRIPRGINTLFEEAREQDFEDGIESEFSYKLGSLIREYDNSAVSEIAHLITNEMVSPEVSAEALLCLGNMDHAPTYSYRLWLLERSLSLSSSRIRDRAALGLASMSNPQAIPYIKEAIGRETCTELREDMGQVLAELEANNFASLATEDKQV